MTNLEAYMVYGLSESEGTLSLSRYSVDPVGTDTNQVASAIGWIDKAMMSDYIQGSTGPFYKSPSPRNRQKDRCPLSA